MASKDQDPKKDLTQDNQSPEKSSEDQLPLEGDQDLTKHDVASPSPAEAALTEEPAKAKAPSKKKVASSSDPTLMRSAGAQSLTRRYMFMTIGFIVVLYFIHLGWEHYQNQKRLASKMAVHSKVERVSKKMNHKGVQNADIKDKAYADLLLKREQMNAAKALRSGRSNIPSVLSAKVAANDFGKGSFPATGENGSVHTKKGSRPIVLAEGCDVESLQNAKKAGVSAEELKCKGCTASALKKAGYSAGSLYTAGYSVNGMKKAGYSADDLLKAGYDLDSLKAADYPLTGKGSIQATSPSVAALKLAGFDAKDLKAMGFDGASIRRTCYSASSLVKAGYTVPQILHMGYLPIELFKAGVSINALKNADVSEADLKAAGLAPVKYNQCDVAKVKKAHGKSVKASVWLAKGCNPAVLSKAGYSLGELIDAGLDVPAIAKLHYPAKQLSEAGVSVLALRLAGVPIDYLKERYGYNLSALKKAGYLACDLKKAGLDPSSLHLAGYNAKDLLGAGFSPSKLKEAGFSAAKLLEAGARVSDLLGAGFSPSDLRKAGVAASALQQAGVAAVDAKKAGYGASDLGKAGYGYGDLVRAGFSPDALQKAGVVPEAKAECAQKYIQQKRSHGVPLSFFKNKGCNAASLNKAGYDWASLKGAGFSVHDLQVAGASLDALKSLFSSQELAQAGVDTGDKSVPHAIGRLKCDRLSIQEAVQKGVAARSFLLKGCGPAMLKAGGYSLSDLRNAGFGADALKDAGFSVDDIKAAGYSQEDLDKAGLGEKQLNAALESQISEGKSGVSSQEALLRKQMDERFAQMSKQQQEQMVKKLQGSMNSEAKKLMSTWSKPSKMAGNAMKEADVISALQVRSNGGHGQGSAGGKGKNNKKVITRGQSSQTKGKSPHDTMIKAGTVSYAVIDSKVTSDDNSPVLATVVEGPLQGSKLLGSFSTSSDDALVIKFNKISMPWRDQSASIDVLAIDPDTAESALASRVDHRFWKRYGIMFAASFIQGMGSAVSNASTTVTSSVGTYTFQTSSLTAVEKMLSALGTVGTNLGSKIRSESNKVKPLVIVDSGTTVGLLFTNDYQVPQ